jgi:steroid delta-isomerase
MTESDLQRYTQFFDQLRMGTLGELDSVMTDDVRFVDPFNDVIGRAKVKLIFEHMFEQFPKASFTVIHAALTEGVKPVGLISWQMNSTPEGQGYSIVGMSEVSFAEDGRVNLHIDHWDSGQQVYETLPIVGSLLRLIRKRLSVD